jgi:hypothetical protein
MFNYKKIKGMMLFEMAFTLIIVATMTTIMYATFAQNNSWRREAVFVQMFLNESSNYQPNVNLHSILNYGIIHQQFPTSSIFLKRDISQEQDEDSQNNTTNFMTPIGVLNVLVNIDNKNATHYSLQYLGVNEDNCTSIVNSIVYSRENTDDITNQFYKYDTIINQIEFEPIKNNKDTYVNKNLICQKSNTITFSN